MTIRKPILCLDFDGVIHSYTSGWKGPRNIPDPPVDGAIDFINNALSEGWDIVIHSSRARYWGGIRAMRKWLRLHAAGSWHRYPAGDGIESVRFMRKKPPAMVTLDDRALTFTGTWPNPRELRAFKPWNKK